MMRDIPSELKREAAEVVASNLSLPITEDSLREIERIGQIGTLYTIAINSRAAAYEWAKRQAQKAASPPWWKRWFR